METANKHFVLSAVSWCNILYCQSRVTVTSCFVYKFIRDLIESIDHLFINPIRMIGLIHK